jgi:hypothetical protein
MPSGVATWKVPCWNVSVAESYLSTAKPAMMVWSGPQASCVGITWQKSASPISACTHKLHSISYLRTSGQSVDQEIGNIEDCSSWKSAQEQYVVCRHFHI